jgi:hypothetical protein
VARREQKNTTQRRPEDWFPPARPASAAPSSTNVIAGDGLTDGGPISSDVTLNVGAGTGIIVNADDVAIDTTAEAERIRDIIGTALVAGANITITVNDAGDTITVAATVPSGYTDEQVRDVVGAALVAGTGITISVDDGADTITITSSITQYTDEQVRDIVGATLVAGTGVTITVDDAGNTITIASSGGSSSYTKYTVATAGDAFIDVSVDSDNHLIYDVIVTGAPSVDSAVNFRISDDNKTTFKAGSTDYKHQTSNSASAVTVGNGTVGSGRKMSSRFTLTGMNNASNEDFTLHGVTYSAGPTGGVLSGVLSGGKNTLAASNWNAFRILVAAGNMDGFAIYVRALQ